MEPGNRSAAQSTSAAGESGNPYKPGTIPLGVRERRVIFQQMVKAEIEAGLLRGSKRKKLLNYAVHLGIPSFEANLILAEVQHSKGQLKPPRVLSGAEVQDLFEQARDYNRNMRRVLIASIGAVLLNVLILDWLFL